MNIADNLKKIKDSLPANVNLVAVSKFHPSHAIQELYDEGHRIFGESRMQELNSKHKELPNDIEWHFIGHLQRNKVKDIIPYTHTIHSVDSPRLFTEIAKQACEQEKGVCCLLQIHIAEEETKYGFSFEECRQLLDLGEWRNYSHAYIGGIMGMATNTDNENQVRNEFNKLKCFFDELKKNYFVSDNRFSQLSMGMSGDYKIAIEEGSTMIRIGTTIFGEREY